LKINKIGKIEKLAIIRQNKSYTETLLAAETKISQVKGRTLKGQSNKRKASIRHCYPNIIFKNSKDNTVIPNN